MFTSIPCYLKGFQCSRDMIQFSCPIYTSIGSLGLGFGYWASFSSFQLPFRHFSLSSCSFPNFKVFKSIFQLFFVPGPNVFTSRRSPSSPLFFSLKLYFSFLPFYFSSRMSSIESSFLKIRVIFQTFLYFPPVFQDFFLFCRSSGVFLFSFVSSDCKRFLQG